MKEKRYSYKKTYVPGKGYTKICTAGECSLKQLEFGMIELEPGQSIEFDTMERKSGFHF